MSTVDKAIDLEQANAELETLSAEDRLRWGVDHFGEDAVLLSSMQKTASVLMHLFHRTGLDNEILFTDTGFHFHETLRLRDDFMRRFHLNIVTLYPATTPVEQEEEYGHKLHLFADGQPVCCRLRKEEPFLGYMREKGRRLVFNGLRRTEGSKRKNLRILQLDPRIAGFALHPIYDWSTEQITSYLRENDVPIHPLHDQSYPSIGCAPCTTPIEPGEDERAGRWRHLRGADTQGPLYCGINFSDGDGI